MNAIIGYADLASRHIDDAERLKKYMKNIQSCGQNLLSLLNDVLDLARIENNKTEMEYVISDIGADFETWVMMLSLIHILSGRDLCGKKRQPDDSWCDRWRLLCGI